MTHLLYVHLLKSVCEAMSLLTEFVNKFYDVSIIQWNFICDCLGIFLFPFIFTECLVEIIFVTSQSLRLISSFEACLLDHTWEACTCIKDKNCVFE